MSDGKIHDFMQRARAYLRAVKAGTADAHTCHAIGCTRVVMPELLMCGRHWRMVPRLLQKLVWAHYRPGQCDDKDASKEWVVAANAAIHAVAFKEGKSIK
jgi:hypothetical protein